jgi:transposase-like protein
MRQETTKSVQVFVKCADGSQDRGARTMKWQPLLPSRKPQADTDQALDQSFERTMSVAEFARAHGWPLPQEERFKWRRCLLVVLGALLATLLLGQLLESLRLASTQPTAPAMSMPVR